MIPKKKMVRSHFRKAVFDRDGHKCRVCGIFGKLDAHHITDRNDMPSGGYVAENGISLCEKCHEKAEEWHRSGMTSWVEGYRPDDLYSLVGSSYEEAVAASDKLANLPSSPLRSLASPPYGNALMLSPDGKPMCRMHSKRMAWYVSRGLAVEVESKDGSPAIRLLFTPRDSGHAEDDFLLFVRQNVCVVCGTSENLTKHHIVPHCYRRQMPDSVKRHSSYDIMPICVEHHMEYETLAAGLRASLSDKYGVAPPNQPNCGYDAERSRAAGYANALLRHVDKIPATRVAELRSVVASLLGVVEHELTDEHLRSVTYRYPGRGFVHAVELMAKVDDLNEFVWEWRRHFIDTMRPRYMPEKWDPKRPVV